VEGEGSNGDMCRRPQEKISMTSSSFNVRILLELNLMVVADILFWFFKSYLMLMLSFIVFFVFNDDEELFAAESRLPHGY
jgi:hypothetical protein